MRKAEREPMFYLAHFSGDVFLFLTKVDHSRRSRVGASLGGKGP